MTRKIVFVLSLSVLLASLLCAGFNTAEVKALDSIETSEVYGVQMLWSISMNVTDVAVSKDGNYAAAVNDTGLSYFASTNSTPRWSYSPPNTFMSVAISADGEYVVAGDDSGYLHYFNNSRSRIEAPNATTWSSRWMYGPIERGSLDMSDDGNYIVVGGTDINVWFYAGCTNKSGPNQPTAWVDYPESNVHVVDISPDGRFVAAGGTPGIGGGFVAFYKDANNATSPPKLWHARSALNFPIVDLTVSDDGYAVAAVDDAYSLRYWANATTLSGDPNATWTNNGIFRSLDMSADGDNVVASTMSLVGSLHFWANARERQGNQTESWVELAFEDVYDVAISDDGGTIAASAYNGTSYKAYFFQADSTMIGEFSLLHQSLLVSTSANGNLTAVAGPSYDSLYVFIPEFSSFLIPPLFMIATLLAVIIHKRKHTTHSKIIS